MTGRRLESLHVYQFLFSSLALAAVQNVTIDDAISASGVALQYFPSASAWNIGNNCSECFVKPDPSKAYDGTWHDTTWHSGTVTSQSIEFTFTGTAVYIYFILANTVPGADTITDLIFFMDGTSVGSFVHAPSSSTDYQYNVAVYANESIPFGLHGMTINPVSTENAVLMLFDYLVYTTDTDLVTTTSLPSLSAVVSGSQFTSTTVASVQGLTATTLVTTYAGSTASQPIPTASSLSLSDTQGNSSGNNNAVIIGASLAGGAAVLALVVASLCYRKYKRRRSNEAKRLRASPFPSVAVPSIPPNSFERTSTEVRGGFPTFSELRTRHKVATSSPPTSTNQPTAVSVDGQASSLVQQVELLRDEVSRLRGLHSQSQNFPDLVSRPPSPPPRYVY